MKPRLYAVNNRKGCNEKEAFDLDIADYQEAYQSENYICLVISPNVSNIRIVR